MCMKVDVRGLPCPQPVIKTKEALENAKGEPLLVIASNEESTENIKRFLNYSGVQIDKIEEENGEFYIYTKEYSLTPDKDLEPQASICPPPQTRTGTTIFINKDRLGHGSDELGKTLINAFIATIKDLSVQPRTICFMNTGVKLTIEGAETQPYLRELEEKGIELLVCGTCLGYFNLKEKLGAGKISNMYDISETMLKSSKVITI